MIWIFGYPIFSPCLSLRRDKGTTISRRYLCAKIQVIHKLSTMLHMAFFSLGSEPVRSHVLSGHPMRRAKSETVSPAEAALP